MDSKKPIVDHTYEENGHTVTVLKPLWKPKRDLMKSQQEGPASLRRAQERALENMTQRKNQCYSYKRPGGDKNLEALYEKAHRYCNEIIKHPRASTKQKEYAQWWIENGYLPNDACFILKMGMQLMKRK